MKDYELRDAVSSDIREALWQYFLDHSQIQKNGYWGIRFYTRDENDFWRRVQARWTGDFVRYSLEEKNTQQRSKLDALGYEKRLNRIWNDKINFITQYGSPLQRFYLFLYRFARKKISSITP